MRHSKMSALVGNCRQFGILKDFYDLYVLSRDMRPGAELLASALKATFEHRRTELPDDPDLALPPKYFAGEEASARWRAWLRREELEDVPAEFAEVGEGIRRAFDEPLRLALTL